MEIKMRKPVIAFVCACVGLLAVPLSLLKSGSIGVEGAWIALVFFLIVESLALVLAWQVRALLLGKITMAFAAALILLMVGNTILFFAR
jgi:hypothetical protein